MDEQGNYTELLSSSLLKRNSGGNRSESRNSGWKILGIWRPENGNEVLELAKYTRLTAWEFSSLRNVSELGWSSHSFGVRYVWGMVLIPIRLLTLPSPLRTAPLRTGASVRKSCTDTSGLNASWKNEVPVFDIVTSPIKMLYRGHKVFSFMSINRFAQVSFQRHLDHVWASSLLLKVLAANHK